MSNEYWIFLNILIINSTNYSNHNTSNIFAVAHILEEYLMLGAISQLDQSIRWEVDRKFQTPPTQYYTLRRFVGTDFFGVFSFIRRLWNSDLLNRFGFTNGDRLAPESRNTSFFRFPRDSSFGYLKKNYYTIQLITLITLISSTGCGIHAKHFDFRLVVSFGGVFASSMYKFSNFGAMLYMATRFRKLRMRDGKIIRSSLVY